MRIPARVHLRALVRIVVYYVTWFIQWDVGLYLRVAAATLWAVLGLPPPRPARWITHATGPALTPVTRALWLAIWVERTHIVRLRRLRWLFECYAGLYTRSAQPKTLQLSPSPEVTVRFTRSFAVATVRGHTSEYIRTQTRLVDRKLNIGAARLTPNDGIFDG
jgi:hypothetical protein